MSRQQGFNVFLIPLCVEDENTVGDQDEEWLCWQSHSVGAIVNIGKMTTNVVEMDEFFAMCNG